MAQEFSVGLSGYDGGASTPGYVPVAQSRGEMKLVQYSQYMYYSWYNGFVFITPNISFQMRLVIERCRKNYYGVYEQPLDAVTGEEKYWPPLTEHIVETVVKAIDFDEKNFQVYTDNPEMFGFSRVMRLVLADKMRRMKWGEKLNDIVRRTAIDGSCVLKAQKKWDPERERWVMDAVPVDLLNIVADPGIENLDNSPILERSLMTPIEFFSMTNWKNKEYAKPIKDAPKIDSPYGSTAANLNPVPNYEVWELWGEMPLSILTEDDQDDMKTFNGHAVLTGLSKTNSKNSRVVVHLVEESPYVDRPVKKPYKELRYRKAPNRRQGRGICEMLFGAQLYLNTIVSIRKNNGLILQNGLFKAKLGSGISQDTVSQVIAGGVIPVENMEDFEQLDVNDSRESSYGDEDRIFKWAQRQTFAYDQVAGQQIPTSQAATNSIIQDKNARDALDLVQEDLALPLGEFFEQFILPHLAEEYDDEDIIRLTGDAMKLEEIDDAYVEHMVNEQLLDYIEKEASIPPLSVVEGAKALAKDKLKKLGRNRHMKLVKDFLEHRDYGVQVVIDNESVDVAVIIQQLKETLALVEARTDSIYDPDKITSRILDLMGINTNDLTKAYHPDTMPSDGLAAPATGPARQLAAGSTPQANGPLTPPTPVGLGSVPGPVAANAQTPVKALAAPSGQ